MGGGGLTRKCLGLLRRLSDSIRGVVTRKMTAGTSNLSMQMGMGRTRVALAGIRSKLDLTQVLLYRLYNVSLDSPVALTSRSVRSVPLLAASARFSVSATCTGHPRVHDLRLTARVCGRGMGMAHTRRLPSVTLVKGCIIAGPSIFGDFRGGFGKV